MHKMEGSSSSSSIAVRVILEDPDVAEWQDLSLVEKTQLLVREEQELADFEQEVQDHMVNTQRDNNYMARATKTLFKYYRRIYKLITIIAASQ
jgi:hypothetical protein